MIRKAERLRIVDTHGAQAVDFLCYCAEDPAERYHAPNTIKKAGTILLTSGHALYSDKARKLFSIEEDSFGGHDTIGGCCSKPSNEMLYGVGNEGCRENFLSALAGHGLGWKDIVPNVNWFMTVPVDTAGAAHVALGSSAGGRLCDASRRDGRAGGDFQLPAGAEPVQQLQTHRYCRSKCWPPELKIPGRLLKHPGQFQGGLLTHDCYVSRVSSRTY